MFKVGLAGTAIWAFLIFLYSYDGLSISYDDFDDMLHIVLIGTGVVWLISFLFFRDE
jgi:hypothetical protein